MSFKIDTLYHFPIVIPDATNTSDGVMTAADKAKLDMAPSQVLNVTMYNPLIGPNSSGSASATLTVPAEWNSFITKTEHLLIAGSPAEPVSGSLGILDANTFVFIPNDAKGIYSVTPGQNLLFFYSFYNVDAVNSVLANVAQVIVLVTKVS